MKTQQAPSEEQERLRSEGLRALARIIARRALAHQGHAVSGSTGGGGHAADGESRSNRGAVPGLADVKGRHSRR